MEEFPEPMRMLQLILAGIILFLILFGIFIIAFPDIAFNEPRVTIGNTTPVTPPVQVSRSWSFNNRSASVAITINGSVYAASKRTYRSTFLIGDQNRIGTRYYRAMIDDPAQDRIYTDLLRQFRTIRADQGLNDDEYLEMMAAFVQTIPYRDGGNAPPKYPAELLVENSGDCDDKAILLAGLLAREDYSVVLFKFGPESHMTLGIGSDAFPYKSTGYTYLESMTPAYVGMPSFFLTRPLDSDPLVLPIHNGTKVYRHGNETEIISREYARSAAEADLLSRQREEFPVAERDSPAYHAHMERLNRDLAIHSYIMSHPLDRPGTFAFLKQRLPAVLS